MLSIIMNYKSDETGDFILNYLSAITGRKQQLSTNIVEVKSVKLTITNELFEEIKKVAEDLNPIITKRNKNLV